MLKKKTITVLSIILIILIILLFILLWKKNNKISINDNKNQDLKNLIDNKKDNSTNDNFDKKNNETEDWSIENITQINRADSLEPVMLMWTWGNTSFYQRYSKFYQKIYTNDNTWNITNLDVYEINRMESFKCFYCGDWFDAIPIENYTQYWWSDSNYVFLLPWSNWWIKKDITWYPLITLWDQALEWILYYTEWNLILFPFSFSVDSESFKAAQWILESQIKELPNKYNYDEIAESTWNKRIKVINWNIVYDKFIWDDKDYIFYRDFPQKDSYGNLDTKYISINRIRKQSDFKIIDS